VSEARPSGRATRATKAAKDSGATIDIADLERYELMAAFREVFSAQRELDRESTIHEVARALGFNRTGWRIHARIRYMFPIAIKRRIIFKTDDGFAIDCRSISDYHRDELIQALLDAMGAPGLTATKQSEKQRVISASAARPSNPRRLQIRNQRRHPPQVVGVRWNHGFAKRDSKQNFTERGAGEQMQIYVF
jgi:hypothetical protein